MISFLFLYIDEIINNKKNEKAFKTILLVLNAFVLLMSIE